MSLLSSLLPFPHVRRFWCHFDDDNYVNVPTLVKVLNEYPAYQDWYLGKPSISSPIEIFLNPVSWQFVSFLLCSRCCSAAVSDMQLRIIRCTPYIKLINLSMIESEATAEEKRES